MRYQTSVLRSVSAAALLLAAANPGLTQVLGPYTVNVAGLTDDTPTGVDHTRSDDGTQSSIPEQLSDAGVLTGTATPYESTASRGASAWVYSAGTTTRIGFYTGLHIALAGTRTSTAEYPGSPNALSQIIGTSNQFTAGTNSINGRSAWLYENGVLTDLRLTGVPFDSSSGNSRSIVHRITTTGVIVGETDRYNAGTSFSGEGGWVYKSKSANPTFIQIGLIDAAHQRNTPSPIGRYDLTIRATNATGQAAGESDLRRTAVGDTGSSDRGESAWVYDGTATVPIGFTSSPEFVDNFMGRISRVVAMNDAGQVIGRSNRFSGQTALGEAAWRATQTSPGVYQTVRIGFTDPEHTSANSASPLTRTQFSEVFGINPSGAVIGRSQRYSSASTPTTTGRTLWVYTAGGSTIKLGLAEAGQSAMMMDEHSTAAGEKNGEVTFINSAGQVAGRSFRYNAADTQIGNSAWFYNGTSTVRIGLYDADHQASEGTIQNDVLALTDSGIVVGSARRYVDGNLLSFGDSIWVYNGSTTIRVGLFDAEHTISGRQSSERNMVRVNSTGQVIGQSQRSPGGFPNNLTAWVFDPVLMQTVRLGDATIPGTNVAVSIANNISDAGVVVGQYDWWDADTLRENRAFAWSRQSGFVDLNNAGVITGGLAAQGWTDLTNATLVNEAGQIAGIGRRLNVNQSLGFFLNPAGAPNPPPVLNAVRSRKTHG